MARDFKNTKSDLNQKVVEVKRVTRVVAGGKRMRFRALVVVGDKKGRVASAIRKGADVSEAVKKATAAAKKQMVKIPLTKNGSIPHIVIAKYKASKVLLKPAPAGSGIIAGGPIRAVVDAAGIRNVVSKMMGSANKVNNVKATIEALVSLKPIRHRVTEKPKEPQKN